MSEAINFLAGVLALGFCIAALFFFRFFAHTRDRLFLMFGISFAIMLGWLAWHRSRHVRTALGVLALLAVQMTIGEIQYRTKLPWWLVLVHVTTAAAVWAAMAAFAYSLWRPLRRSTA